MIARRGAHGRLAAIVVLAGGLSTCASTPPPVEHHEPMYPCGGNYPPLDREILRGLIEKKVRDTCGPMAVSAERYSAISVVLRPQEHGVRKPLVETEGGDDLSDEIRRCVKDAASRAIPEDPFQKPDIYYSFVQDLTIELTLGPPVVRPRWQL